MAMGMQGLLARAGHLWLGCVGSEQCAGGRGCCRPVGTSLALPCAGGLVLESKCLVPCDGLRAFGARACRFGAGIRAKHWGLCTWSCAAFWSTKLCLLPPPRLMGWECTTVPCVCCVWGSRGGKCCFFHSELLVRAGRGWVCEEGRQGRAHSRALFLAVGLDDVLCCSLGRAHSSGNIWGFT